MNRIQNVGVAFANEVAGMASLLSLHVPQDCVRLTFSLDNAAQRTATQCFRLDMAPEDVVGVELLRGMRRDYDAVAEDGSKVRVTCHLSGGIHNGQMVDWSGKPVDALG